MTWKRLKGTLIGRVRDHSPDPAEAAPTQPSPPGRFSCEAIILELDHGRTLTLRREPLSGQDSVTLTAEIPHPHRPGSSSAPPTPARST